MATVTHLASSDVAFTTNVATYTSASQTPLGNALLVVFAMVSDSLTAAPTCTGSANGMTFSRVGISGKPTATGDRVICFISDQLTPGSPVAMTVTVDVTAGDVGSGGIIGIEQVTGMTLTGLAAVRQSQGANGAGSTTPTIVFGSAVLTTNPTLVGMIATSGSGTTAPTSFTSAYDRTYATPTESGKCVFRSSGHTSNTITWGSTATQHAEFGIELDASAAAVLNRSQSDTASATDTQARALALPRSAADSSPAIDAQTRSLALPRAVSDTAAATDACTYQITRARSCADSAPATDADARTLVQARAIANSAPATDSMVRTKSASRTPSDSAPATDGTVGSVNPGRTMSDSAPATDAVTRSLSQARALANPAPATDTCGRASTRSRAQGDSAPATDTVARLFARTRGVSDTALTTDANTHSLTMLRLLVDTAPATDATVGVFTPGTAPPIGAPARLTTGHQLAGRIGVGVFEGLTTNHDRTALLEVSNT